MYVDDGQLTEPSLSEATAQQLIERFFELMGMLLAADKRQDLDEEGLFLGIAHSFAEMAVTGDIVFWPRQEILDEVEKLI